MSMKNIFPLDTPLDCEENESNQIDSHWSVGMLYGCVADSNGFNTWKIKSLEGGYIRPNSLARAVIGGFSIEFRPLPRMFEGAAEIAEALRSLCLT